MSRRAVLSYSLALLLAHPAQAWAFGESGVFHPRLLVVGEPSSVPPREAGLRRWAYELSRRTSAPTKTAVEMVSADHSALFREPLTIWSGGSAVNPLTVSELRGLERYLRLGGLLIVDDANPEAGVFSRSVRHELGRVLPETSPIRLDLNHVLFRTFYIIEQPVGRVANAQSVEAILQGKNISVLFLGQDLLGALAYDQGAWLFDVNPGGALQREHAVRFAVNIAMYALCSDYKDDQVHAPWIMRRRARQR